MMYDGSLEQTKEQDVTEKEAFRNERTKYEWMKDGKIKNL